MYIYIKMKIFGEWGKNFEQSATRKNEKKAIFLLFFYSFFPFVLFSRKKEKKEMSSFFGFVGNTIIRQVFSQSKTPLQKKRLGHGFREEDKLGKNDNSANALIGVSPKLVFLLYHPWADLKLHQFLQRYSNIL